jgi:hypothetical protein
MTDESANVQMVPRAKTGWDKLGPQLAATLQVLVENAEWIDHGHYALDGYEGFDPAKVLKKADALCAKAFKLATRSPAP